MAASYVERKLIIASRVAEGYHLTEIGLKNLQHIFTVWFPRAIYRDLTDETVRVDVIVRIGRTSGKGVYTTTFVGSNGTVIKKTDYDEDRLIGKVCDEYDQLRSGYCGKKDGFDFRIVVYTTQTAAPTGRR